MTDPAASPKDPLDDSRMTIGEHLNELRTCVVRSLLALVIACAALAWPTKYLLEWIVRPVTLALQRHGQPDNLLATSPTEPMLIYIKVVLLAGLIVASPYIVRQVWMFVAAGLYPKEKRWVGRLVPVSVGLFLLGVAFMYSLVLLVSLNFLVGFGNWIPLPRPEPTALERAILGAPLGSSDEVAVLPPDAPRIPVLETDPANAEVGQEWFNRTERKRKIMTEDGILVQSYRSEQRPIVTTHFKIGDYLSFVLTMTIAFGLAFQMPLVVLALVRLGVMSVAGLRRSRKYFVLGILVLAGILAPPEFVSHMLLSVPMLLLFEVGVWLAARQEPRWNVR